MSEEEKNGRWIIFTVGLTVTWCNFGFAAAVVYLCVVLSVCP